MNNLLSVQYLSDTSKVITMIGIASRSLNDRAYAEQTLNIESEEFIYNIQMLSLFVFIISIICFFVLQWRLYIYPLKNMQKLLLTMWLKITSILC